jgi:hypothetical protein
MRSVPQRVAILQTVKDQKQVRGENDKNTAPRIKAAYYADR